MFGRVELILVSIFFYVLGTIIEASCKNVQGFAAGELPSDLEPAIRTIHPVGFGLVTLSNSFLPGAVFYQIGYTCVILLVEVVVADTTSLRSRLFFSYIPALPFIINTWVSAEISSVVLQETTWRWGKLRPPIFFTTEFMLIF